MIIMYMYLTVALFRHRHMYLTTFAAVHDYSYEFTMLI